MKWDRFSRSSRPRSLMLFPPRTRTEVFAWYTLAGSLATALGALFGGGSDAAHCSTPSMKPVRQLPRRGDSRTPPRALLLALLFTRLSPSAEVTRPRTSRPFQSSFASFLGIGSLTTCRAEAVGPVRAGRLRGRLRRAELRRLLVLSAFRRGPGNARRDFLLGEHLRGYLRAVWRPGSRRASA